MKSKTKRIPFEFVFDYLYPLEPVCKPMFGCVALYLNDKIELIFRDKEDHVESNGVWLATSFEHHESLKKEFPSMTSVYILSEGKSETNWQMLSANADDFEPSVIKVCELVKHGDKRIGRIPKGKSKSKRTKKK